MVAVIDMSNICFVVMIFKLKVVKQKFSVERNLRFVSIENYKLAFSASSAQRSIDCSNFEFSFCCSVTSWFSLYASVANWISSLSISARRFSVSGISASSAASSRVSLNVSFWDFGFSV